MAKEYGKCFEARKPSPVKKRVQGLPIEEGKNLRLVEHALCSFIKFYSKKQLRRIYKIKLDSEYKSKEAFMKKKVSIGKGFNQYTANFIRKEELVL